MKKFGAKGFTVLELLIVIAIICILLSLILVGLNAAQEHSNDENKISKIQTIVIGLGEFYDSCGVYPATLTGAETCAALGSSQLSDLIPDIASYDFNGTGSDYKYVPLTSSSPNNLDPQCTAFHIGVELQTDDSQAGSKSGFYLQDPNPTPLELSLAVCGGGSDSIDGTQPNVFDIEK